MFGKIPGSAQRARMTNYKLKYKISIPIMGSVLPLSE